MRKRNVEQRRLIRHTSVEQLRWFAVGLVGGLTMLSIALGSVPTRGTVTDDTALYQSLSEIRVHKQQDLNFDGDIARLSALEDRYREEGLPRLSDRRRRDKALEKKRPYYSQRVQTPMQRIANQRYRYTGVPSTSSSGTRTAERSR